MNRELFRLFLSFFMIISSVQFCGAQTTPISGVVNSYYRVVEVLPAQSCVRLNTTAGLNYNDKVMIVQMKGASINTSNSSSFGDTTSLNNAGNYEIGTVCHVDGDSLFLVYMLLNQYTVSGKVQVVKIPQYVSATVTDTLKPAPWNNITGTGGVLAIRVERDLTLNAPVFADSSGFRGGEYRLSDGTCSNFFPAGGYVYNANNLAPQDGSFKGEAVVDVAASQSGGKGAPANGGGGGNNHNNGGAGGANLSAGGDGGGNSSSVGCRVSNPAKGGKALSNYGGSKIFLGGGGGAGHSNFNFPNPTGGGHGGGIIFIEAENLIGNNYKIVANGSKGGNALGDGASGSGAGGTLILDINNYVSTTTIQADGAQGGTANDGGNVGRCYGAGGGGSGGAIYFSTATPALPVTVTGGAAGPEIAREASCNAIIPALAGSVGQIIPNYNYSVSTVLESGYCAYLLPVGLIWFKAINTNGQPVLSWKIADAELADRFIIERAGDANHWIAVNEQPANEAISLYKYEDLFPKTNNNFYRLKMIGKDGQVIYSTILKVFIPTKNDPLNIYPNPAHKKITVSGNISFTNLYLFDLTGKLLLQKKNNNNQNSVEIDLPDLSDGVYILKIGSTVKKLVIR
ncbi:MAG: T9SS type A sorting domain-containing protein [Chitinophagaceae bacterium]